MNVKQRILAIKLKKLINQHPEFAKQIGVEIKFKTEQAKKRR